eukprot:CAMPEP_0119570714 /NCGR_PEP_ID=MMETSP1352-20130426/43754_1 /TAXON_ID=265584 /ORGANISM="Stauroneis constricta, Strain CCMP1120" /LENGTH=340 /DNA_ID=CAMNT_0007620387 /DNA_START=1328 /DNA_END=2350 /DNA_ORIENTATION=+
MSAYALFPFPTAEPAAPPQPGAALHSDFNASDGNLSARTDSTSSLSSSMDDAEHDLSCQSTTASSSSSSFYKSSGLNAINESGSRIAIAIKDAKFNPVRLIQSVLQTSNNQSKSCKQSCRRRNRASAAASSTSSLSSSSTSHTSPPSAQSTRCQSLMASTQQPQHPDQRQQTSKGNSNQQQQQQQQQSGNEDAIEFELSITFQGRKYNATRTMQCLIDLRNALIQDMHAKQRTSIPELPQMNRHDDNPASASTSASAASFVGRSFTMLHHMLVAYCPDVERWLQIVMSIVPDDSEILANFLFEPSASDHIAAEEKFHTSSLLIPIQEGDTDDEDDDDDAF